MQVVLLIVSTALWYWCVVVNVAGGVSLPKRNTTMTQVIDEQRLTAYLNAESKYKIAPIPTPIDLAVATRFVNNRVSDRLSPERMSKLARLAILYDLKATAPAFLGVLKSTEKSIADYHRSAWALIALAWIGSQDDLRRSQAYLHQLQSRASVWENRLIMLDATEAFGPTEGTDKHRSWVQEEIGRRKSLISQYQTQNKQNEARGVQNQIDELEEHLNVRVATVDRSNAIRSSVLGLPIEARISRLAAIYVGTEPSTPALSSWSAFTLVRVAKQDMANSSKIASQFATLAKQHQRSESDRNAQSDLIGARSLRAVEYFGQPLNEPDRLWLKNQEDTGFDLLALRPVWIYQ